MNLKQKNLEKTKLSVIINLLTFQIMRDSLAKLRIKVSRKFFQNYCLS